MIGSRRTFALAVWGLLALGLRVWVVLALPEPEAQSRAFLWLQCLAGTAIALAVAWLGWSLLPEQPSVGWLAGVGAAVYPPHLQAVAQPCRGLWAALVLTSVLALAVTPWSRARGRVAVAAGLLVGFLFLIEPSLILVLPVCAVVFWWSEGQCTWMDRFGRGAFARVALMVAVVALPLIPAMAYNRVFHGRFALAGTIDDPTEKGTAVTLSSSDGVQSAASAENSSDPFFVRLRSLLLFDQDSVQTAGRFSIISRVAWLLLALIGLSVSRDQWRQLWPTYAVVSAAILLQSLGIGAHALRMALEPMTFVWASAAIAPLLVHFAPRQRIRIYRPGEMARDPFADEPLLQGPHYDIATSAVRRRAG